MVLLGVLNSTVYRVAVEGLGRRGVRDGGVVEG
jgi:hypothetical protein